VIREASTSDSGATTGTSVAPDSPSSDAIDKATSQLCSIHTDTLATVDGRQDLVELAERARQSIADAVPENTTRAYGFELRQFSAWCTSKGLSAMPAATTTVVMYMRDLADHGRGLSGWRSRARLKPRSIERALAAICMAHAGAGHGSMWKDPLVDRMRDAIRREHGYRPVKKTAAEDDVLRRLVDVVPSDLLGLRDRLLLTLGWGGAFRRSELVALDVSDVTRDPMGLIVLVRTSKTDQQARGEDVPVFAAREPSMCPVRALDEWLSATGISEGPIFRAVGRAGRVGRTAMAASTVAARVKRYARLAKLEWSTFAGHSLRSGHVTTAAKRGRATDEIMVTTRHRSRATVDGYIQRGTLFARAGGKGLL
jgi:integrase